MNVCIVVLATDLICTSLITEIAEIYEIEGMTQRFDKY